MVAEPLRYLDPISDSDRQAMLDVAVKAREMLDHDSIPDQLRAVTLTEFHALLIRWEALARSGGVWDRGHAPFDTWVATTGQPPSNPRLAIQLRDGEWRTPTGVRLSRVHGWCLLPPALPCVVTANPVRDKEDQ